MGAGRRVHEQRGGVLPLAHGGPAQRPSLQRRGRRPHARQQRLPGQCGARLAGEDGAAARARGRSAPPRQRRRGATPAVRRAAPSGGHLQRVPHADVRPPRARDERALRRTGGDEDHSADGRSHDRRGGQGEVEQRVEQRWAGCGTGRMAQCERRAVRLPQRARPRLPVRALQRPPGVAVRACPSADGRRRRGRANNNNANARPRHCRLGHALRGDAAREEKGGRGGAAVAEQGRRHASARPRGRAGARGSAPGPARGARSRQAQARGRAGRAARLPRHHAARARVHGRRVARRARDGHARAAPREVQRWAGRHRVRADGQRGRRLPRLARAAPPPVAAVDRERCAREQPGGRRLDGRRRGARHREPQPHDPRKRRGRGRDALCVRPRRRLPLAHGVHGLRNQAAPRRPRTVQHTRRRRQRSHTDDHEGRTAPSPRSARQGRPAVGVCARVQEQKGRHRKGAAHLRRWLGL